MRADLPAEQLTIDLPGTLPERFAAWFASRGWTPHPHQLALLDAAARGKTTLQITASFGVCAVDAQRHDCVETAMHDVDRYLYLAKEQGRNRTVGT